MLIPVGKNESRIFVHDRIRNNDNVFMTSVVSKIDVVGRSNSLSSTKLARNFIIFRGNVRSLFFRSILVTDKLDG